MEKCKIILLNGPSSSGKSSIAIELQSLLKEPYMHLGIDTVFSMIPPKCKCDDSPALKAFVWEPKNKGASEVHISVGSLGHRIMAGFHRACATLCSSGINLILDHFLFEPRWTQECLLLFHMFDVCFVGLRCPIKILERRERERGDRQIGLARFSVKRVHKGNKYDIEFDTSCCLPRECAEQIIEHPYINRPHNILRIA